uniref:MFS domain-containing protein n=1 Tax=Caenorhabditis japonica TaxID=281687 RepID=A0A8R1EPR0_CAEJA
MKVSALENQSLTPRLLITSVVTTLAGGFHFGYLISAVNPLADILQQFMVENLRIRYSISLSSTELALVWSTLAGCLFAGAMLGAYISVWLLPRIGPRRTLLCAAVLLFMSTPVFGLAHFFELVELLPVSRIISGVGFAIGISAQGVYLTEISPGLFSDILGMKLCKFAPIAQ